MPLGDYINGSFRDSQPSTLRIAEFRGINQSGPEETVMIQLGGNSVACYTPRGRNFWIEGGELRPRNGYEQVFSESIHSDIADIYSAEIKSMYMCVSKASDDPPVLLAGVYAHDITGYVYSLLQRKLGVSDKWEYINMASTGWSGPPDFQNANFEFVNFTGNFTGDKTDDSVTVMCNGIDMPVAYVKKTPAGAWDPQLYLLRSDGWYAATPVNVAANTITIESSAPAELYTNGSAIQLYAMDQLMPGGLTAGTTYYVINASSRTIQLATTLGGTAIDITSSGGALSARLASSAATDAPIGEHIFVHGDRLWMSKGNILYYSDKFYADAEGEEGYAHCRDWTTKLKTGNVPVLTFDGDKITGAVEYRGSPIISKENSIWRITNTDAPFGVEQVFSSRGTISRNSICEYMGTLLYAVPEGIMSFNGTTSAAFATNEIRDIWLADNSDCICKVVGDVLYVHGNMIDPITNVSGKGLLAIHIPTKNICFWDLVMGGDTRSFDCSIDSWFTTLLSDTAAPQLWFADGDLIYRVSESLPETAEQMTYFMPMFSYGTMIRDKFISRIAFTGKGGALTVTPIVDGNVKSTKTVTLPPVTRIIPPSQLSLIGGFIGMIFENTLGSIPAITNMEQEYTMGA